MQCKVLLIIASSIVATSNFCIAQWKLQNPQPVIQSLRSVVWVVDKTFIAVGGSNGGWDDGVVLRTTDAGLSWEQQSLDLLANIGLTSCIILKDRTILAGGRPNPAPGDDPNILLKSTDDGDSWQVITGLKNAIFELAFFDELRGCYVSHNGVVYLTVDGGEHWDPVNTSANENLSGIATNPEGVGIAVGENGTILRSTDAGATWTQVPSPSIDDIADVAFADDHTIIAAGDAGLILRSTDDGVSWTLIPPVTADKIHGLTFETAVGGVALGSAGCILVTTDAGLSWQAVETGLQIGLMHAAFSPGGDAVIVGSFGQVLTAYRTLHEWDPLNRNLYGSFERVHFADRNHGIIGGPNGQLLMTENGGEDWRRVELSNAGSITGVCRIDSSYAWVLDQDNQMFKSSDGGLTWQSDYAWAGEFGDVFFFDWKHGYHCGYGASITADGGTVWLEVEELRKTNYTRIDFFNPRFGIILSTEGYALTTNGGVSWIQEYTMMDKMRDVQIIDDNNIVMVGDYSILYSTDKGQTWQAMNMDWTGVNFGVHFKDTLDGYICCIEGIYHTSDRGEHWTLEVENKWGIHDLFFVDETHGWAVNRNGLILHTDNWGVVSLDQPAPYLSHSLVLGQNYPNPVNDRTTIEYIIANQSNIRLAVYDLYGRQLEVLVEGEIGPGSHFAEWSINNRPPGTYIYRLEAKGRSLTRIMTVVK
jgi:photosystem II stability/assembly factor-like uncharacterized protein